MVISEIREVRFSAFLVRGALAGLLAHMLFVVIFSMVGADLLVLFNIASILLFTLSVLLARRGRYLLSAVLILSEVVSHAALAIWLLGWTSGFHYYFFCLMPLVLILPRGTTALRIAILGAFVVIYAGLDYASHPPDPQIMLDPRTLAILRTLNITGSFTILGYLVLFLRKVIHEGEEKLAEIARTDLLTGLHNRRSGLELIGEAVERMRRDKGRMSIVLVDIDHFKRINDQYGHQAGDQVIAYLSEVLRQGVREGDAIIRWGGEEFLIVLPEAEEEVAKTIAERIQMDLAEQPFRLGNTTLSITLTFGISESLPDEHFEIGLARADAALYKGKSTGRNCVTVSARPVTSRSMGPLSEPSA